MALLKELHQLNEISMTAMSPSSKRGWLVKKLESLGFKVHSREQSPGALKAWLDNPAGVKFADVAKALGEKVRAKSFGQKVIEGPGYEIELQSKDGVYVAVYRKGTAGQEYEMGIDT